MAAAAQAETQGRVAQAQAAAEAFTHFSAKTAAFWAKELTDGGKEWYGKAENWWVNNSPATVDGVLGGYGKVDPEDVKQSARFWEEVQKMRLAAGVPVGRGRCLDGGAGIGRVSRNLLSHIFDTVDLVEGNRRLLEAAPEFMDERRSHLGELICETLQDVVPAEGLYDCIWVQWVVIYLTDADFVCFLRRCVRGLRPGGMIVIKENVLETSDLKDLVKDEDDSSVTRSQPLMKHIFQQAGLELVLERSQENWGSDMLPVWMYALKPLKEQSQ
mmetsp:Transcript_73157/g.210057  ORF Transcript_73157/g.210057 Transcript_73157/m.210057 type:complete len:272 (-) Transcript_73157:111-926(-)